MTPPVPVRLQRSRAKDADNSSPNGLPVQYVGRPWKYGNPYRAVFDQEYGWAIAMDDTKAETVPDAYFEYLPSFPTQKIVNFWFESAEAAVRVAVRRFTKSLTDEQKAQARAELQGKNLSCWCRLCDRHRLTGLPLGVDCPDCDCCHADVLLEIANGEEPTP